MNPIRPPLLLPLLLGLGFPALAQAGVPTDQIRQTTDKILAIVQSPALKGPDNEQQRRAQMSRAVAERFDWAAMARSALGKHWAGFPEAQRKEFTGLFSQLVENNYMAQVESYSGEKVVYKGDKVEGAYGVVDVVVVTLRGREIPVSYRVLQKGGEWLVYDVNVEGVSLVNNYRSQIGSILNNSSYEALVARIRAKLAAGPADQGAKGRRRAKEDAL